MSWLTNIVRPRIRKLVDREVPDNLWVKCPACDQMIFHRELEANLLVCPHCNHHMRLSVSKRLTALFDGAEYQTIELPETIADPLKLLFKEDIIPTNAHRILYVLAPSLELITVLMAFAVIPFGDRLRIPYTDIEVNLIVADLSIGVLWIFAMTGLGVYGIILAGWASANHYSFMGGLRSSAQIISYEHHARRLLLERNETLLDDRTQRALGILRSARLLGTEEAMKLLSRVRLAIHLDRLPEVDIDVVNRLFLQVQPAHLQLHTKRPLGAEELRAVRATVVRQSLA